MADQFWDLWNNCVSAASNSVHPIGNPIAASAKEGCRYIGSSALWNIEPLGHGDARFTFYTIKRGEPELAASIVAPLAAIPPAILMGFRAMGVACGTCRVLKGQ